MKNFTLAACEKLINEYVNELGGQLTQIEDGVLGLGELVLHDSSENSILKTIVIKEVYLNQWSSGHTIRRYNKIPKKYLKHIES